MEKRVQVVNHRHKQNERILSFIKVDYDTFVNSVYLRQNDIYSLANPQKPNQGREVLEQIINLEEYDGYEKTTKNKIKITEKEITEAAFFIDKNKDVNSKIDFENINIEKNRKQLLETENIIEKNTKDIFEMEIKHSSEKEFLNSYNSLKEQIKRSELIINNNEKQIESDKLKGKTEVVNKEKKKK